MPSPYVVIITLRHHIVYTPPQRSFLAHRRLRAFPAWFIGMRALASLDLGASGILRRWL
jgi:hypothetical protein